MRRYSIVLPPDAPLQPSDLWFPQPPLALSPDGEWLVYVARTGTSTRLMRRKLDALEVEPIEWAEGNVSTPFFSPDGQWVGFGRIWGGPDTIRLSGGMLPFTPRDSTDSRGFAGAAWQDDGFIVFATLCPPGIHRISSDGETVEQVTVADHDAREHVMSFPEPLPGGRGLAGCLRVTRGLQTGPLGTLQIWLAESPRVKKQVHPRIQQRGLGGHDFTQRVDFRSFFERALRPQGTLQGTSGLKTGSTGEPCK